MIDEDKQLVESWWIDLWDSIEPAKEKINYSKEYRRKYQKSPEYKEYQKKYQKSPKYKEYKKKYMREYGRRNREKILAKKKEVAR